MITRGSFARSRNLKAASVFMFSFQMSWLYNKVTTAGSQWDIDQKICN